MHADVDSLIHAPDVSIIAKGFVTIFLAVKSLAGTFRLLSNKICCMLGSTKSYKEGVKR